MRTINVSRKRQLARRTLGLVWLLASICGTDESAVAQQPAASEVPAPLVAESPETQGASLASAQTLASQAVEQYQAAMELTQRDRRLQGFGRAEQLFRQVAEQQGAAASVPLLVNLGNAALQAERPGWAVWAYRRALQQQPSHSQALQNLTFARQNVPEQYRAEANSQLIDTLFFWTAATSRGGVLAWAAGCFLAAALLLAAGLFWKQPLLRNVAVLPLVAWSILLLSTVLGYRDSASQTGVVVADELTVYSADSVNAAPRFANPLPSGVEFKILRQRDRWCEIQLPGGRSGWAMTAGIRAI